MHFDFDEVIDRTNTLAMAKEGFRPYLFKGQAPVVLPCPDDEAISMWVADMAFASAPAARQAMIDRVQNHPIFGYSGLFGEEFFDAFSAWTRDCYGWSPKREHFLASAGVVPALFDLVEHILKPGEKTVTLTPAYGYFKHAPTYHGHEYLTSGLVEDADGNYRIDFDDFESKVADPSVGMFFLCHPHNPTGRVWTETELREMATLCFDNDVLIVSDEIHCDLRRHGVPHIPLAKLFPDSDQIITAMSSSKTFNLAGLGLATVVIPNDEIRAVWQERNAPTVNPVSVAAATGVYRNGHQWHDELRTYLDANMAYISKTLDEQLPRAVFTIPDATYLAWINLSAYFEPETNLTRFFAENAGVIIEGGDMFIDHADGHIRVNAACPRSVLTEGLKRIMAAVPVTVDAL